MLEIREVKSNEKEIIEKVSEIHISTFQGFFLTFMGKGFLNQLYLSFCKHKDSGLLAATKENKTVGFLAYSSNYSDLFKYMIKTRLIPFAWYSLIAFIKKPKIFLHLISAFLKPSETKRSEQYIELSSIGIDPNYKGQGIGSQLINSLKQLIDFKEYKYISLETDAENNDVAIHFYEKNGFVKERLFETSEGRKMFEYRYSKDKV